MRLLLLFALTGCVLGGSSENRMPPYSLRNANACAFVAENVVVGTSEDFLDAPGTVKVVGALGEFEAEATLADGFAVVTLPPTLPPGTYRLGATRSFDGQSTAEDATLTVTAEPTRCGDRYRPQPVPTAGMNQVHIAWPRPPGSESYELFRTDAVQVPFASLVTTTDVEITDSGLQSGRTYYYKLTSRGPAGTFESRVIEATTAPPQVPLFRAESNEGAVKLSWGPANGAQSYTVERSTNERDFSAIGETVHLSFSFAATERERAVYRVRARNGGGPGPATSAHPAVARTPRELAVCMATDSASSSGLLRFDAGDAGNVRPFARHTFNQLEQAPPGLDLVAPVDGLAWVLSTGQLTAYAATANNLQALSRFALRQVNGEVMLSANYARCSTYDAVSDRFYFAGAVASGNYGTIFTTPRLLLTEPSAAYERSAALVHNTNAIALRQTQREIMIASSTSVFGPNPAIHFYSADMIGAAQLRAISGSATTLSNPVDLVYDPSSDTAVVLDNGRLLRFPGAGDGNIAPVWETIAPVESIAIDPTTGDIYGLRNSHDAIDRWLSTAASNAQPADSIALPAELHLISQAHLAYDASNNRLWLSATRSGQPLVAAVVGPSNVAILSGEFEASAKDKFAGVCAVSLDTSRVITLDRTRANFGVTTYPLGTQGGIGPSGTSQTAFALGASGVTDAAPARTFALSQDGSEIYLAGQATYAGPVYADFVAAVPFSATGITSSPTRRWVGATGPTNTTQMVLGTSADEVLLWSSRTSSISVFAATLAAPVATISDTAATGVIGLAYSEMRRVVLALREAQLRLYARPTGSSLLTFASNSAIPDVSKAASFALDDALQELFVADATGKIVVLDLGTLQPKRTIGGNRTGLEAIGPSGLLGIGLR